MAKVDYNKCRKLLQERFAAVEAASLRAEAPEVPAAIVGAYDILFQSKTQAYREVLLGCILARIDNPKANIRLPYISQGKDAYNGRTLDQEVVNPFLGSKKIPCSRGPFLSVFRRQASFQEETRAGVRDKPGFDSLLLVLSGLQKPGKEKALRLLDYHLFRFIQLREHSQIDISKLRRISLEQCDKLISDLLEIASGGRFPVFLIVAAFRALKAVFDLKWDIGFQGINVANGASGAGGDITIRQEGQILLAAEVTERAVGRSRVVSTFDTKIAPNAIEDYLFFIKDRTDAADAIRQARRYFSQGHEVNFMEIKDWMVNILSLLGKPGRDKFMSAMVSFLETDDVPAAVKTAWNEVIGGIPLGE